MEALGVLICIISIFIVIWFFMRKPSTFSGIRKQKAGKEELQRQQRAREEEFQRQLRAREEEFQRQLRAKVDDKVDIEVKRLYKRYGEEWINNAGRSRLAMAIDEMLGPAPRGNSNAARAQRTLAAAVLETVLERKAETIRQQQAASGEDSQAGIVVDPMLAADIVDTAVVLAEEANHINDLEDVDDIDDTDLDDIDDIDDLDLGGIDLDLD